MILGKKCIRGTGGLMVLLFVALAISFLVLSFKAADNETLLMFGQSYDVNFDMAKRIQYTFIFVSFLIIMASAFGVSAAFSGDHCVTYLFGYFSLLMFLTFGAIGTSIVVLKNRLVDDFDKECASKTGVAYTIDSIYNEGVETMCTKTCPCKITDKSKFPDMAKWKNKNINMNGYL